MPALDVPETFGALLSRHEQDEQKVALMSTAPGNLAVSNGHPGSDSPSLSSVDRFGVNWQGRVVVIVGLAKSGVAAAKLLQRLGCRVRMTELRDTDTVRTTAAQLIDDGVEHVEWGAHSPRLFDGCEVVITSPGVPESAAPIHWATERQLPIISEIELAFRFCRAPIVAVTGTTGKSSVVTLIQRLLQASRRPAVACGNIGIPFAEVVPTLTPDAIAVVEVSSFQLARCDQFRPSIGVLLNLGTNHLDWHQDRLSYFQAKARLFRRQTSLDYAVLNAADPEVVALSGAVRAQRVWFGGRQDVAPFELDGATCRVLLENAQAVLQVGRILGVPDPLIYQTIREFRGLEHRLEYVTTIRGVRLINDAKSTTPDSLVYALEQVNGPVVPIIGGKDKGLDVESLRVVLADPKVRGVVLIGESRHKLRALINGTVQTAECETLEDAVQAAMRVARPGDTIVFSPAFASFDMFRNFEERGRQFKQLVWQFQSHAVSTIVVERRTRRRRRTRATTALAAPAQG